jgi:hypothetical protein
MRLIQLAAAILLWGLFLLYLALAYTLTAGYELVLRR